MILSCNVYCNISVPQLFSEFMIIRSAKKHMLMPDRLMTVCLGDKCLFTVWHPPAIP